MINAVRTDGDDAEIRPPDPEAIVQRENLTLIQWARRQFAKLFPKRESGGRSNFPTSEGSFRIEYGTPGREKSSAENPVQQFLELQERLNADPDVIAGLLAPHGLTCRIVNGRLHSIVDTRHRKVYTLNPDDTVDVADMQ